MSAPPRLTRGVCSAQTRRPDKVPGRCGQKARRWHRGGDDQKVVNFEQILFANGRMLDLTEAPAQRGRALNLTFDRSPSGCPLPSLRNMSSERNLSCNYLQFCKANRSRVSCRAHLSAFSQQWSSASVGAGGHWEALRGKPRRKVQPPPSWQ